MAELCGAFSKSVNHTTMSRTKTTNADAIKLAQYQKKYEALIANREKFEEEIEKIDEQMVELDEKIEMLSGKLNPGFSMDLNTVLLIIIVVLVGWYLLFGTPKVREHRLQPAAMPTSFLLQ